jgi:hypothetical protein
MPHQSISSSTSFAILPRNTVTEAFEVNVPPASALTLGATGGPSGSA